MIKLMFCVRRLEEFSEPEFHRYWRDEHGPLVHSVRDAIGVVRYVQSHTVATPINDALRQSRGAIAPFDGAAELWWESMESFVEATSSDAGREAGRLLLEDERRFVDLQRSALFLTEEIVILE